MMKAIVLVLFCISTVICSSVSVSFQASANISTSTVDNNGWQYRKVYAQDLGVLGFYYESVDATENSGSGSGSVTFNALVGGVNTGLGVAPLTTFLAVFNGAEYSGFSSNSNASASVGYAALTLGQIYEVDVNGNVLVNSNITLKGWSSSGVQTSDTDLTYVTYTNVQSSITVSVTFMVSARVGRTTYANSVVTPRSIESVVSISGYTFANSNNHLVLEAFGVSGSGDVSTGTGVYAGSTYSSGSGDNSVYFSLASQCYVGGSSNPSTVGLTVNTVDASSFSSLDSTIFNQAHSKYASEGSITVKSFAVSFPAGAGTTSQYILYDPTVGSGTPPTQNAGGSSSSSSVKIATYGTALSFLVALIFVLF